MAARRRSARVKAESSGQASPSLLPQTSSESRRRTRNSILKDEIPDSDETSPAITPVRSSSQKATDFAIVIPSGRSSRHQPKDMSTSGSASSPRDGSSDEDVRGRTDTPDTSAVATPAVSVRGRPARAASKINISAAKRALDLQNSKYAVGSRANTGKRAVKDLADSSDAVDDSPDAVLARKLQAEEYGETIVAIGPSKRRKTSHTVADTDESSLSDISRDDMDIDLDDSDDDVPIMNKRRSFKVSRVEPIATRTKPTRKGKAKAVQSFAVDDSDEPELTELASDFEESEFSLDRDSTLDSAASSIAGNDDNDDPADMNVRTSARRSRSQLPRRRQNFRSSSWSAVKDRKDRERKKLERAHPEIKTMWDDLKAIEPIKPVQSPQPEGISRKLKSFQLEGLNWMTRQEKSSWRGGLLGDEMGMGKTIQAVSLIMSDFPAKDPTLVVVPPVALMQWQNEINAYTDGKLQVLIHHGSNSKVKSMKKKDLVKYNVIMVSYSGLESMYRKESKGWNRNDGLVKEDSILHAIHWHRIILDEAHSIKQRTTGVAKACFALNADYKWCLSGTPVQNRIGEFFSLLRFLELQPFSCYFCKACDCKQIHWSQDANKMCTHCNHSGFSHVSVFNQEILNPITQGDDMELRKAGLAKLRLITDRIMLRRIKRDHTASMELPPKEVVIHNEFFGEIERDFSSSIMSNTSRTFDTYVSRGVMLNNYANIFGLIMQMRQVSNHPDLILKKHAQMGQNVLVCSICDEVAEDAIRSRCKHEFCRTCAKNYIASFEETGGVDPDCPRCHIALSIDLEQPEIEQEEDNVKKNSIINRIKMEDWTSSTKIEMLIYDLYKLRSKKVTHKSIVFSQFTSMLQLVEWRLRRAGFNTVMLDGSMSPAQRQKSIEYFMNNIDVEVFLVSLKAGGVALNLTEASRVYIVDPWWNPAAEWQSADRCHRIGQKRPCVITRLCVEDSVESRIVMLQEKKANMINGTINNDQVALEKLTPEDMQFLFRGS